MTRVKDVGVERLLRVRIGAAPTRPRAKNGACGALRRFAAVLLLALCAVAQAAAAEEPYKLNPGDILQISVWKEEGLQQQVLVLPDGDISFPLAGHIKAAGLSPEQLQKVLHTRLKNFFADPVITVTVVQVSGNKIYVIGQVRTPGEFPANRPIDVMQALSLAGGLTTFAADKDIKVLRRDASGKQRALAFNYSDVSKGQHLDSNVLLQAGDVVVVPTSGIF
jgi:polysaccharide biosynthesis/export protein